VNAATIRPTVIGNCLSIIIELPQAVTHPTPAADQLLLKRVLIGGVTSERHRGEARSPKTSIVADPIMTSSLRMARGGRLSRVVRAVEGESLRSPFLNVKQGDSADYPGAAAGHRSAARNRGVVLAWMEIARGERERQSL
jgi:hypothetical protein